ncbi:MAG TPA: nucleoside triphosphate pyrophosphohydrolase [Clostridiales bacterium]|nr:nucleoside triphosphate pyrophosphohydrolase [Clostridiales bacterium]
MNFQEKEQYTFNDLVAIMKLLRAPGGCPWDIEQTHKSIRQNFIEETYEVVEAIDNGDAKLLQEELGDVLLQVVFHAEIESENNSFDINDVADGICKKLIIRHPHVFSNVIADTTDKVLKNWDDIKMKTKSQSTQAQAMDSVSKALPSLMRSQKIQQKASKIGFDWDSVDGALDKLDEEVAELKEAIETGNQHSLEDEMGDVLFSAVNVSRFIKTDPEKALYNACNKFITRFNAVENMAEQRGISIKDADIHELDGLWDEAKKSGL